MVSKAKVSIVWVIAPRREHSRKPDEVASRIEKLIDGPYIDLFGRQIPPGWDVWADEAIRFDGVLFLRAYSRQT